MSKYSSISRFVARLVLICFVTQTILPVAYAADQIVNTSGGAAKTPLLDAATNGVPIVHITRPNASGVSHNLYQQFNVSTQGVILNNAAGSVQTQLGGTIGGNLLSGGIPARIILNEVTGAASVLLGTTEIAGANAEFVLANPNGISCNGCGFINASRASLVTGVPLFTGTNLTGFNIGGGSINIGANGLNALSVNELDLLSRSLSLSGGISAKNLYGVTGLNTIDYTTLEATPYTNATAKPTMAVDIAALGGMYANQIYLLATEQGVGVNNLGRLEAQGGGLSLDVNGTLTNKGLLKSGSGVATANNTLIASATDINNNLGTVQADGLVLMQATQTLKNTASSVQGDQVRLSAGSTLTTESSVVSAAKDIVLSAGGDLNIVAGSVQAGTNLSLLSGKDLDISPLVNTTSNTTYGTRTSYVVNTAGGWAGQNTMAGLTVYCSTATASMGTGAARPCTGPQTLAVQVPDGSSVTTTTVTNKGTLIEAKGSIDMQASKGSISMDALSMNAGDSITAQAQSIGLFGSKDEKTRSSYTPISGGFISTLNFDQTLVRGGLNAGWDISLLATGDTTITGAAADMQGRIFVTGSNINSDKGVLSILGTGDVDIANDVTKHISFYEYYQKKKSLFKKKVTTIISTTELGQIEPSFISANSISIGADHDLNIVASDIIADNNVGLYAGNDLDILSTGEIFDSYNLHKVKTSGIFSSGGFGITIGSKSVTERTTTDSLTQITSSVSSLNGDIYATAGNQYLQRSSELITPQGSINIAAKEAAIQSNNNTQSVLQSIQTKQTGLTIGLSSPLLTAGQTIASVSEARRRTDDPRMQGLAMLTAGLTIYNNFGAVKNFAQDPTSIVTGSSVGITFGTSKTSYESLSTSSLPKESILTAGRDINITATGDKVNDQGNISIVGAMANANGNVNIKANNDINLAAAVGTTTEATKKSSSSASIGVNIDLTGKVSATLGISNSRGFSNGWGTTYFPTELTAKQALTIESGRHTTLKGATVSGDKVTAKVGTNFAATGEAGNLAISSPQDASHFIAKETSSGFNISIPIGSPGVVVGLSASDLKLLSDYQSAKQQTAIRAGAGGFDIKVNGHTQLDGGAIASTADVTKNHLSTQTLDFTNLANRENTSGTSTAISLNLSSDVKTIYAGSGLGTANINQSSYGATLAAIAPADITITRPDLQVLKDKKYADVTRAPLVTALNSTNASIATLVANKTAIQQQVTALQGSASVAGSIAYWQSRVTTLQSQLGARPSPPTETQCSMAGCQTVVVTSGLQYAAYTSALSQYNTRLAAVNSAKASLTSAQSALAAAPAQISSVDTQIASLTATQTTQQAAVNAVPDAGATLVAISRNPNTAHKPVTSVFDSTKATAQLNANTTITMAFARAGYKAAGDYAGDRLKEVNTLRAQAAATTDTAQKAALNAQANALYETWKDGGIGRITLHAIIGGMAFGADGAIAATANQLSQPVIAKIISDAGITDPALVNTLKFAASIAVGAGVGGAQGAAAAFNADANNRQLHKDEAFILSQLKKGRTLEEQARLDAAACALAKCADGISTTAPGYQTVRDLQTAGEKDLVAQDLYKL
jgi:filamentous hemagglutinin family protein